MSVHEDIIDTYKRMTNVQAMAVGAERPFPDTVVHAHSEGVDGKLSIVPGRVYILRLNDLILGVLAQEQRAIDEVHEYMHATGCAWETIEADRRWMLRNQPPMTPVRLLTIDVHDVR